MSEGALGLHEKKVIREICTIVVILPRRWSPGDWTETSMNAKRRKEGNRSGQTDIEMGRKEGSNVEQSN
jgi:hypothetical protein